MIKTGVVRIVERDVDGERLIATHGRRSFIGDVDMLTGRSSLIVAIANEQVEAFQLCSSQLRKLLNSCPNVSEILLEAFQMRRKLLASRPFVGVRVVGTTKMNHPKIKVIPHSEVTCINGESRVESIETRNSITGETDTIHCPALFIFIGAQPHTAWLPKSVLLDDKGFVLTGSAFYTDPSLRSHWSLDRTPCDLETTVPVILAGGDVRAGTTKRCGFAVGDGSLAVSCVHRLLVQS